MRTVYRVEHKDTRVGPYQGGSEYRDIVFNSLLGVSDSYVNPCPSSDFKGINRARLHFIPYQNRRHCFLSLRAYNNWFFDKNVLERLEKVGMVLGVYNIPSLAVGKHQAVFRAIYHTSEYRKEDLTLLEKWQS